RSIGPVAGRYRPSHCLHKATGNCESKPRPGAYAVLLVDPIELVKDMLELGRWNALAFIQYLNTDRLVVAPSTNRNDAIAGRVLCRVVDQIEKHLLEQDGINLHHREI